VKLPKNRVRYYLLDWKDSNINKYIEVFGEKSVNDLTEEDIRKLYDMATEDDRENMFKGE